MKFGKVQAATVAVITAASALSLSGLKDDGSYRKVANEGQEFTLAVAPQKVRFGKGSRWVEITAVAGGPCTAAFFGGEDPAPGVAKQCDVKSGPAIDGPPPGGETNHNRGVQVADSSKWPALQPGSATLDLTPYQDPGPSRTAWDGGGEQRIFCNMASIRFDDPIANQVTRAPGLSHLHTFFGNTAVDYLSTSADIRTRNNPTSTCLGGSGNFSAYWVPGMLDMADSGGTKGVPIESVILIYYKSGIWRYIGTTGRQLDGTKNPPPAMTEFPLGLKMITGDARRTTSGNPGKFNCHFRDLDYNIEIDPRTGKQHDSNTIPTFCPQTAPNPANPTGDPNHRMDIWSFVRFGQCWNGQLDTAPTGNHRDHIVDAQSGALGPDGSFDPDRQYQCPSTHPLILVHVELIPETPMPAGGAANYVLASDVYTIDQATGKPKDSLTTPRGYSIHGDLMMGWDPDIVHRWHTFCMTENNRRNCGVGGLGDGYGLAPNHGNDGSHRGNP